MSHPLRLLLDDGADPRWRDVAVHDAVIVGWTGRDAAAVEHHIAELEAIGVKRPASTPIFYRVAAARLTVADRIEATGTASSGEVEFVLLRADGETWVGVGSDHTDREVETYGVTVSKQMCDKPVAPTFWRLSDVAGHWDSLMLRSYAVDPDGSRALYQEGTVAGMLPPLDLIGRYLGASGHALPEGCAMFGGTLPVQGGVRPAARFEFELEDKVRNRSIRHGYGVRSLPVLG